MWNEQPLVLEGEVRFGKCEKMGSFPLDWTVGRPYPQGRASFQNLNGLKNYRT